MANFLGKKISLISKAGIRYEGILYTIDQIAFTVALSKVKSFGTEDRVAERFIAARDEVYEYIIFRGSDISDLHVCENSMYTDDSAIVKIMSPNLTNPSSPPAQSSQHAINTDLNTSETVTHHQESLSPVTKPQMSISKRFMNFSKVNSRPDDRSHDNHQEHSQQRYNKSDYAYHDSQDLDEVAVNDYRQFQNREQMVNKSDFFNSTNDDNRRYTNYHHPTQRQRGSRGPMYSRGYSGGGGGGGGRPYRANKDNTSEVIKDDFDFESANALMAAELAHMHVGAHDVARDDPEGDNVDEEDDEAPGEDCEVEKPFYDKSKSFFDNISSEVTERFTGANSDRRPRNNMETFGASEYNRGGGMNQRGGGGYRTGGNSRWNGGGFRGGGGDSGYGRGSSAGFIRRGSNYGGGSRGADTRFNCTPFSSTNSGKPSTQRRPYISGFGESY